MTGHNAVHDEAAYYQTVQEFFVSRRGDPLMLSNADWFRIRCWKQAGIPLRIVLRGIQDALEDHARSWARRRKMRSLRACARAVEEAHERWRRALSGGDVDDDTAGGLLKLAETLEGAQGLGAAADRAREVSRELRVRADSVPDRAQTESWLAVAEGQLAKALRAQAGHAHVKSLEADIEADLEPYRERLPSQVLAQVRSESLTRRLFETFALPRLSLMGE